MLSHRSGEAPKKRAKLLYLLIIGFLAVVVRLVQVQFFHHDHYNNLALKQSQRDVILPAERGRILDRHGEILAESYTSPSLWADPGLFKLETEDLANLSEIARIIQLDLEDLLNRLQHKRRRFVWLKRRLNSSDVETLVPLVENISGLYFKQEWSRFYALDDMLTPALGIVGAEHTGLTGLEGRYNKSLNGTKGKLVQTHDARGRVLSEELISEPQRGKDVRLSIDSAIQTFLFKELTRGYEEFQPLSTSGVVLDPHSGEILAMATLPSHQPGDRIARDLKGLKPKMVLDTFEPGSIMKPLIYASMIQENLGTPEERYHCGNGRKRFGPRTLNDVHGYGYLTMEEIIIKSSNIGAAEMGIRLGKERVFHVLDQLGFGHKNHLPFAGEPRGTLRHFSKWTDHYSITSIPMGHEMSVNMIQMARAYGALANGGTVIQPCLEKAIVSYDGIEERRGGGLPIDRVFSQNTCDVTLRALEGVVQKGTARRAKSKIYRIGGKTGTTEKIVDGKYSKEHNIGSFVAIAPLSQPRLVVVVMMDEPKGGMSYGGVVAGPIVRRVIEDSLQYMGVVPDIKQGGDS